MPHSQDGKKTPIKEPSKIAKKRFFGTYFLTTSGLKNSWSRPEIRQPTKTNGNASMTTDKKIILICDNEFGID
jgi:hypothetical protein